MTDSQPMRAIADDEPLMIAWKAYRETPGFENTKLWATHPTHVVGSLWAAFSAGFLEAHQEWKPIAMSPPKGWGKFFLIRPMGKHPRFGGPFTPTVVQQGDDGQFYRCDNEIDPIEFGQNMPEARDPSHPLHFRGLEWRPLPE